MKQAKLLTLAELKRVFAGYRRASLQHSKPHHLRLSFYTRLSACEIASLRTGDTITADGQVRDTIFLKAAQTIGDEANTVLVNQRLHRALSAYAAKHPQHVADPNAPLFRSAKRGGFTPQTIVNLFARFYALAGIKGASSHSGRHQFLTALADQGVNVRVIQALARHKNISTTQRYIDYNESKLRAAVELV